MTDAAKRDYLPDNRDDWISTSDLSPPAGRQRM